MKRIVSIILVLCLVFSVSASVSAESQIQHNYSTSANSGVRGETCTTLLGTHVDSYYTGSYTYEKLSGQSGSALLSSLRTLMTSTHTKTTSYDDCHYKANLTDCENGDGKSINLIYTGYSATQSDWINTNSNGWNREHVWPQSLGGFKTSGAGADLHHLRPSDSKVNSTRGNKKYGNVTSGKTAYASIQSDLAGGTYSSAYFEPLDNVKGDVARIILYMYVRYGGDSRYTCSSVTTVFQSVDVLLGWCALDPVDTWEMGRNEVVAAIQGNRNVFIDYPELAWLLFEKEIPVNLTTPSNGSSGNSTVPCTHSTAVTYEASAATCTSEGYTGDIYCADCGTLLESGTVIPVLNHTQITLNSAGATCSSNGYTGDIVCSVCGITVTQGEVIPATGNHSYGDWVVVKDATAKKDGYRERICSVCGHSDTQVIAAYGDTANTTPPPTEGTSASPDPDQNRNNETDGDRSFFQGSDSSANSQPVTQPSEPTQMTEPADTPPTTEDEPPETVVTSPGETTISTEPSTQESSESAPGSETSASTQLPVDTEPGSSNGTWILICGIVLVVCAAGIILYFTTEKTKARKAPDADNKEQAE